MIQWQNFSVNISGNCIELENTDGGTGTIPGGIQNQKNVRVGEALSAQV